MSIMAGFDLVIETSNATLLDLIKRNLEIQGKSVVPPFEISIPISGSGVSGSAHVIVDNLLLDLNADDTLTLTFLFSNTSVNTTSPVALMIFALDGDLAIRANIALVDEDAIKTKNKALAVNLGTSTVTINFSSAAKSKISSALTNIPSMNLQFFTNLATQAVTQFVHGIDIPKIPLGISVVSGVDGSLTSMQLEKAEVHCIENPVRAKQALGLFGIFLVANHANGNHSQKTSTAITANHNVSMSISPKAFHSLLFCPALAKEFNVPLAKLPTTCGASGGVDKNGVTITKLSDSFAQGHIDIDGSAKKSGTCYEANATFHGEISIRISSSTMEPELKLDEPYIDVHTPWYCWLATSLISIFWPSIFGLVLGIGGSIAMALADVIGKSIASGAIGGIKIPGFVLGLDSVSFDEISVTPEGLTLGGKMLVMLPSPASKSVTLKGSVITSSSKVLSTGTYHFEVKGYPEVYGDYPYTEYAQQQIGTYEAVATLLGRPLTLEWQIEEVLLSGSNGTVTIPKVETQYPFPLPGGTKVTQEVHIGYSISGNVIKLTNVPKEGNYSFLLYVTAKDPLGEVKDGTWVLFEGDKAIIGGDYYEKMTECSHALNKKFEWFTFQANQEILPHWVPINYPPAEELMDFINAIARIGLREADEFLVHTMFVHGTSFLRALGSQKQSRLGLEKRENR